ncbi:MAG: PilZ domain-containing protein [Spirochaetota bacterium]|nr:MAG: PilZ domain-containing protein [Spirochaetota bacterium]
MEYNYQTEKEWRLTRIPVEYEATYHMGDISGEGIITDVSEGGIAMRVNQTFIVGDELVVESMISSNLILEFTSEIRSVQGNILGIEIKEIDPDLKERFLNHIDGILRMHKLDKRERYVT